MFRVSHPRFPPFSLAPQVGLGAGRGANLPDDPRELHAQKGGLADVGVFLDAEFQARVRYAKLGVDLGHSLEFSPDRYRELALEMIEDDEMGAVGYVLEEYLDRLFRFLHGPASYAHTPIKGPAPNSFLRCVFALENVWASEVSGNQIGESNPRVSLNRATAQPIEVPRRKLGDLYNKLFALVSDSARRGELFADAVLRYRHWAVPTPNRETEGMDTAALRSFGSNQDPQALAQKMEAHVNAFWEALTPHLQT